MNCREIKLIYFAELDFLVHNAKSLGVLCRYNNTCCISVYSVTQGRGKALLVFGGILALAVKISLNMSYKIVLAAVLVLVNRNAWALRYEQDVFVLINHGDMRLNVGKGGGRVAFFEEFLG